MFAKLKQQRKGTGAFVGSIGLWLLHIVALLFMVYSAYHGIHATTAYRASSGLGNLAGILGIVAIELTLAALYLAAVHSLIIGGQMIAAAGVTAILGFTIATLSIVGDSQMQAGFAMSPWLTSYLTFVLPAAPVLMALGAAVTILLSPSAGRARKKHEDEETLAEARHTLEMNTIIAEEEAGMAARQIALDTKLALLEHLKGYANGPDARRMIEQTAAREGPNLLRAAGIYISDGNDGDEHEATIIPLVRPVGQNTQDAPRHAPLSADAQSGQGEHGNGAPRKGVDGHAGNF